MRHRAPRHGFTLVEILAVIVIILIIAGWILAAFGPASNKAARARTEAEIKVIEAACEAYKSDYGSYPRFPKGTESDDTGGSAPIDPRQDGNPTSPAYANASVFLYK